MVRLIRPSSGHSRQQVRALLQALFVAELVRPSRPLWLTSPWIKDIPIIDNRSGAFRLGQPLSMSDIPLSAVLAAIALRGGRVVVTSTSDPMNAHFFSRLQDEVVRHGVSDRVRVNLDDDERLHEKGLVGADFYLSGSMNYTFHGLMQGREALMLTNDPTTVATMRAAMADDFGGWAGDE